LHGPELLAVVVAAVGGVAALLRKSQSVKNYQGERALEFVETAVRDTYEEYVREAKNAAEDGKLTSGERKDAMNMAISKAKNLAAVNGFNLLKFYAAEYLPVLIEKVIRRDKAEAGK
jgi:hypothetical protein